MSTAGKPEGALAIVLHTHMPYVEGFGTWPFGEEWLWEALASCYLPLLDLLDAREPPVTLSVTPVLADQLGAPGLAESVPAASSTTRAGSPMPRTRRAARGRSSRARWRAGTGVASRLRARSERMNARGETSWARSRRMCAGHRRRLTRCCRCSRPMPACECRYKRGSPRTWIVSALTLVGGRDPLTGAAGSGCPSARMRPTWSRCSPSRVRGYLCRADQRASVSARASTCAHCVCDSGVVLWPIDRATISLVWSDKGYPADGVYRDYHRHTIHHHNPWRNDGEAYDHELAITRAREHAADFVTRARTRICRDGDGLPGGGLAVCALDTELLGHWWYEGLVWLEAVIDECARQGLELVRLDDALDRFEPAPVADVSGRRVRTRSGGRAAGARTAICPPGRVRPSPSWRSRRVRPSWRPSPL